MDFLLISPPIANFGQATAALGVLTAYLRSRGWEAHQWDLAIESFHHFHSLPYLRRCRDIAAARSDDSELKSVAERVVSEIESAKTALQEPRIARDSAKMGWALETVRDAGVVLTAASLGRYEHDFRHFGVPGALTSFDLLDAALEDPSCNPFIELFEAQVGPRLLRDRPLAIGISISYLSQLIPALTLVRTIRAQLPSLPIILGGAYLTATSHQLESAPASVLRADAVCLHDGEHAIDEWLKKVLGNGGEPSEPNIMLPRGGVYRPSGRPAIQTELDTLPVPSWIADGLDLDRYLVPKYSIGLPLSRGCHWGRCNYCNISSQTAASYRRRSVPKAMADIRAARAETGSNWFDFSVDSFRPKDLRELALDIVAEDLDIEWGAEVLLDAGFKNEVVAELARSGCRCLRFGLESASHETLRNMNKPTRPDVASRILGACHDHGIRTAVMLIVGYPTETQAGLQQTYDFVVDNRDQIDFLTFHPYSLVPGSPMAADPGGFGLYLQSSQAVFSPNLPFVNTNPGGLQSEHVLQVIDSMKDALREYFPDLGELWSVGIGGWLTFASCCGPRDLTKGGT